MALTASSDLAPWSLYSINEVIASAALLSAVTAALSALKGIPDS